MIPLAPSPPSWVTALSQTPWQPIAMATIATVEAIVYRCIRLKKGSGPESDIVMALNYPPTPWQNWKESARRTVTDGIHCVQRGSSIVNLGLLIGSLDALRKYADTTPPATMPTVIGLCALTSAAVAVIWKRSSPPDQPND